MSITARGLAGSVNALRFLSTLVASVERQLIAVFACFSARHDGVAADGLHACQLAGIAVVSWHDPTGIRTTDYGFARRCFALFRIDENAVSALRGNAPSPGSATGPARLDLAGRIAAVGWRHISVVASFFFCDPRVAAFGNGLDFSPVGNAVRGRAINDDPPFLLPAAAVGITSGIPDGYDIGRARHSGIGARPAAKQENGERKSQTAKHRATFQSHPYTPGNTATVTLP